jgi:hypothetical protein
MVTSESTNRTVQGITILHDRSLKARDSIRFNWEGNSNEIDKSDLQYEKHSEQRISTLRGITIDLSDEL